MPGTGTKQLLNANEVMAPRGEITTATLLNQCNS